MALKKIAIGSKVLIADNQNKVMFTKSEWDKAKKRYQKELAKKIASGQ